MPGFGGLAVLLFAPYIADILGRRMGTAIGCVFIIMGSLIQSFPPASHPEAMYLAGRFFIGFGANISNGCCPLLITEIAHPQHRGKVTTIYNTLWYLGAIIAAWTTCGTLTTLTGDIQWRLPTGLQCLMPGNPTSCNILHPRTRQSASSGSSKAYFSTNIRILIG
jgi:MFS family permease